MLSLLCPAVVLSFCFTPSVSAAVFRAWSCVQFAHKDLEQHSYLAEVGDNRACCVMSTVDSRCVHTHISRRISRFDATGQRSTGTSWRWRGCLCWCAEQACVPVLGDSPLPTAFIFIHACATCIQLWPVGSVILYVALLVPLRSAFGEEQGSSTALLRATRFLHRDYRPQ